MTWKRPSAQTTVKPSSLDLDDLAELAADAFRVLRGHRLRLEDLQRLAVERRPRAGRGIAAADQRSICCHGLPQSICALSAPHLPS